MHSRLLLAALAFAVVTFRIANAQAPLDPTLDGYGILPYWISSTSDNTAEALRLDGHDRILTAGFFLDAGSIPTMFVSRHVQNGLFDSAFGNDGVAAISSISGLNSVARSLAIDHHGRIIVAGSLNLPIACSASDSTTNYVAVVRIDDNGQLDSTFGTSPFFGVTLDHVGDCMDYGYWTGVAVDAADNVIVATSGFNNATSTYDFYLLKWDSNGRIDETFGDHGKVVITNVGGDINSHSVTVDDANRILVAALADNSPRVYGKLLRFSPDGSADTTFGVMGVTEFSFEAGQEDVCCVQVDSNRRVYVGGMSGTQMFVGRFTQSGAIDATFGARGVSRPLLSFDYSYASNLFLDQSDRINVVGAVGYNEVAIVAHFNLDGTLNTANGTGGVYLQPFGLSTTNGVAGAVDAFGRTTVVINASDRAGAVPAIARYDELFAEGFD